MSRSSSSDEIRDIDDIFKKVIVVDDARAVVESEQSKFRQHKKTHVVTCERQLPIRATFGPLYSEFGPYAFYSGLNLFQVDP